MYNNVIYHVSHTWGKSVSVFWATQHGFKARPGLVHVLGTSRLLMYSAS